MDEKAKTNKETINVPAVTLSRILRHLQAPKVIDFLSLDVEGHETKVLESVDLERYTFLVLNVERPDHKFHDIMIKYGYKFMHCVMSWGDCFYLHQTIPGFDKYYAARLNRTDWHGTAHKYLLETSLI